MKKKSLVIVLLVAVFITRDTTVKAQKAADSNTRKGLAIAAGLLQQGMYAQIKDSSGQIWNQSIEVDQQQLEIVYKYRKATDSNSIWEYHIPVMDIDSISQNWKDTTAVIFTKSKSIQHYLLPNEQDVILTDNIRCYMRVGRIRNLTQRILNNVRDYQQYHKTTRPEYAREIVKTAVYNFIDKNKFNTADVRKLYVKDAFFIAKCQLCDGVKRAFWQYLQAKTVTTATDPEWEIGLMSPVQAEQEIVLEKMVGAALKAYYQGNEMFTEKEVQEMKEKVAAERKRSMTMTNNKKCINCDGAFKL